MGRRPPRHSRRPKEAAVPFVEIAAPPTNLLRPELVRDRISLIKEKPGAAVGEGVHMLAALHSCLAVPPPLNVL
jgi:hypothetical protein